MRKMDIRQLTVSGLMAALVLVGTMLIQVPTPTRGYIHIGDSMVYISGIVLGPFVGSVAAAIGSLLADLFSGYGIYAPVTFVVKGLDGLVVGYIYHKMVTKEATTLKKIISFSFAVLFGGTVMVLGYLAYESLLYGYGTAVLGLVGNVTQAVGGGILAAPLVLGLDKIKTFKRVKEDCENI